MIGILLAGGAATRLPNKSLLPMKDGRPVCFSGMDYLFRHKANPIAVVTPPNSVIVDIIDKVYGREQNTGLEFIYQAEPTGVGDAINLVECEEQLGMIVMADNIYDPHEKLLRAQNGPYVIVRDVAAWRLPHLVRVGPDDRLTRTGPGRLALSTPWLVNVGTGMFGSAEGWPDLHGVPRLQLSGNAWWDIGTPDTYAAYWRSTCKD